jgi:hypothetical protein
MLCCQNKKLHIQIVFQKTKTSKLARRVDLSTDITEGKKTLQGQPLHLLVLFALYGWQPECRGPSFGIFDNHCNFVLGNHGLLDRKRQSLLYGLPHWLVSVF